MKLEAATRARPLGVTAAVAVATFYVAYDGGGYSLTSRSTLAIAVWWTILVGVAVGAWRLERVPRAALLPCALLALLAAWTLASAAWSPSAEDTFAEFGRTALYLGVYVLVVLAATRSPLSRWIDGLAVAIVAIGLVALVSRLFPGSFGGRGVPQLVPSAGDRLSFPLDYWNGVGIFVALAFPLLLHLALEADRRRRWAALGSLPVLGAVLYLTSSRGAVFAAVGGTLVLVLAHPRRLAAFGLALVAAAGVAASVAVLELHRAVVDGPFDSGAARSDGRWAAAFILVIAIATAAVTEAAIALARQRPPPGPATRRLGGAAIAAAAGAGVVAVVVSRPWEDFTRLPSAGDSVAGHLRSGEGSGRWQFWQAALDEFRDAPLHGGGAGSYESWWAQHGSFSYFVRDAHSLYLETLGELGLVGLSLLVGALVAGAVVGVRRLVRAAGSQRSALAALLGTLTAFAIGAGIDWMWEVTAVTVVGICALALLAGTGSPAGRRDAASDPRRRWIGAAAVAVLAGVLVVVQAIALLADLEVRRSQAAFRAGDTAAARSHAVGATKLEPWAGTPYLQLALVEEGAGELAAARRAIEEAIERDPEDWRPWLVASRIESRLGHATAAARSRARARALNPRSALLNGAGARP